MRNCEGGEVNKITTPEMEVVIADYFNYRTNIIVPRVSWGAFVHECDLLVLTKANYAIEVEIKIDKYDLKKDILKRHSHNDEKIKKVYMAIPIYLCNELELIPKHFGILIVKDHPYINNSLHVKKIREAKTAHDYKWTDEQKFNLARLGAMRIWRLSEKLNKKNKIVARSEI